MDQADFTKIMDLHNGVKRSIFGDNQVIISELGQEETFVIDQANHIMHHFTRDTRPTRKDKLGVIVKSFPIDVVQYVNGYYEPASLLVFLGKLKTAAVLTDPQIAAIKELYGIL